tara:strand:+ start:425 stop:577 length:153 start_codon:yes stop_codon:yes gene_type:complete
MPYHMKYFCFQLVRQIIREAKKEVIGFHVMNMAIEILFSYTGEVRTTELR